jgi:hypothetical protein
MAEESKEDIKEEKEEEQSAGETEKAAKKKEKKKSAAEEKPLDKMTVKELREVALEMGGIEGVTGMKKEQLLETIKKEKGIEDEAPAKKKKGAKIEVSVAELKEKIAAIKKEKREAQKAKDKTQVKILRRRISRLKKKTRKAALAA